MVRIQFIILFILSSVSGDSGCDSNIFRPTKQSVVDERVDQIRHRAIELSSAHPNQNDWSDLQSLAKHLAGARIVQLGEQTHGDGTAFLFRTRIVRDARELRGLGLRPRDVGDLRDGVIGGAEREITQGEPPRASLFT